MTTEPRNESALHFKDNDDAYLQWLESNPHGFVVNSH